MIVADASVVLKWILPDEPLREEADLLRGRHVTGEGPVAAPDLLLYEVANVLSLRCEEAPSAVEAFGEIGALGLHLHAFDLPGFGHAIELAHRYGITAYDASYVVLAQALRCRLVTADERLLERLKGTPYAIHLKEAAR